MEHPPNKWSIGKDTPIEWRYFNFKQKGLSGIFTYPLFNVGGVNKAYVASELYMGGKSYGGPKILKLSDVSIKKNCVEFTKKDRIDFLNRNETRIKGSVEKVSWNLKYTNNTHHEFPMLMKEFGLGRRKNISWKVFMPSAKVTGSIVLNGKRHRISADGYFDGNWGKWMMYDLRWNWLQFSRHRDKNNNFIVALGDLVGLNSGKVMVVHNGKKIIFDREKDIIRISQKKWERKTDPNYPKEIDVSAENKNYRLDVHLMVTLTDDIIKKNQFPIPDVYIIEENTNCHATLSEKKNGKLCLVNEYSGPGFSEYTTETYKRERQFIRKILGKAIKKDTANICVG